MAKLGLNKENQNHFESFTPGNAPNILGRITLEEGTKNVLMENMPLNLSRKKFGSGKSKETSINIESDSDSQDKLQERIGDCGGSVSKLFGRSIVANSEFITFVYNEIRKDPESVPLQPKCVPRDLISVNKLLVYDPTRMINSKDKYWRVDGYNWKNLRSIVSSFSGIPWKVVIHRLVSGGKLVNFYRKEFRLSEQKWTDFLTWRDPHVYVMYCYKENHKKQASFDLKDYEDKTAHGNASQKLQLSKNKRLVSYLNSCNDPIVNISDDDDFAPSKYIRTSESCKSRIRELLQSGATPMQTEAIVLNEGMIEDSRPEDLPRNRAQIYQIKRNLNQGSTIEDELAEIWKLSFTSNFVPLVKIQDQQMLSVMLSPSIHRHIVELLQLGNQLVFHYDTTYNIGKFYCSILVFKHPFFEGSPPIPAAFLFHQSKTTDSHKSFFRIIAQKMPAIDSARNTFVSDREAAIKLALADSFPLTYKAYCHRHIKENILHWREGTVAAAERNSYAKDVDHLLKSHSRSEFDEFLSMKKLEWSPEFDSYFERCLKIDVVKSCRVETEPRGIFYPLGGVSNNASESTNSVFKEFVNKRMPSTMLEAMYKSYMFCFTKFNMIKQAIVHHTGNYKLLKHFRNAKASLRLETCESKLDLAGLHGIFELGTFSLPCVKLSNNEEVSYADLAYKSGIAELFVKTDRVKVVGGGFFVTDLEDKVFQVNCVDETCTCGGNRCVHYLAVEKITCKRQIVACGSQSATGRKKPKAFSLTGLSSRAISRRSGKKANATPRERRKMFPILAPRGANEVSEGPEAIILSEEEGDGMLDATKCFENDNLTQSQVMDSSASNQENNEDGAVVTFWQTSSPFNSPMQLQNDLIFTEVEFMDVIQTDLQSSPTDLHQEKSIIRNVEEAVNAAEVSGMQSGVSPLKTNDLRKNGHGKLIAQTLPSECVSESPSSSKSGNSLDRCPCLKPKGKKAMICCFSCRQWLHQRCAGVDKQRLQLVKEEGMWFCAECDLDVN